MRHNDGDEFLSLLMAAAVLAFVMWATGYFG